MGTTSQLVTKSPVRLVIQLSDFVLQAKKRPRLGRHGNVYSPTAKHEMTLAWCMRAQVGAVTLTGDVRLTLRCNYSRGDLDNYIKTVCDALEKSAIITNDRQIVEIVAKKCVDHGLYIEIEEDKRCQL